MDRLLVFTFILFLSTACANSILFTEDGQYIYTFRALVTTGTIIPKVLTSSHGLRGNINIQKTSLSTLLIKLSSLRHTLYNNDESNKFDGSYKMIPHQAQILEKSFIVSMHQDGIIENLNFTKSDPLWSMNIKRAIAASLQMQITGRQLPGAFKINEPCLHGMCIMEYSSSNGVKIRKSNNVPTLVPSATHDLWMSVMTNICNKDTTKNPLIGTTNRWYTVDQTGLLSMVSEGNIEVHYHKHIFQSLTNFTLERIDIIPEILTDKETHPIQTGVAFQPPDRQEPTGGRAPLTPESQLEYLWEILGRLADGLEQTGLTDTLLKDKLPLRLQGVMSMLSHETLKKAHEELQLGTSYKWETMKNIFLEALPQAKSKAAILLVRDLVVDRKIKDETAILHLLRKFPFNVADLSESLLRDMESLLKLSQEHSQDVRHAAILGFSTLVFKTFMGGACTTDVFEHYVQTYFSRFTESPDYSDRLVWLSGLANLQLEHVTLYLTPVISGTLGHSTHERFLSVWATMPLAPLYAPEIHNTYWPILHNKNEPLEMRVAATTMLILAEPTPHRLLSLYWYISSQNSPHLNNFFYTTIKSIEKTTFDCYKRTGKLASYLGRVIKRPKDQSKLWATGNYLFDAADSSRDMGFMMQSFIIANEQTGLPDIFYFSLITHNAGLVVQDYAVYLKLQGVASNVFSKLHRMNGDSMRIDELADALKKLEVQSQPIQPVHVELLIKYQGKVIYALHLNQTTFDKWTEGDIKKSINSVLQSESHINQQILIYPTILKSILPSEIGTPIITDTMLSSLTSIRGNLTHAMENEEIARRNDVHFRTSTLALIGLAAYNPISDTHHLAEVAQVSDAYFPANFTIALSIAKRIFRTSWLSPGGGQSPGFTAYSGARVAISSHKDAPLKEFCPACPHEMFTSGNKMIKTAHAGMALNCDTPSTLPELFWQLVTSHESNSNILPGAKPWLVLLHVFVLAAIPAEGPCKISLSSPLSHEKPERTDTEIGFVPYGTTFDNVQLKIGSVRRSDDVENVLLSTFNSTSKFEWNDNKIKLHLKATGKNSPESKDWKLCFDAEEKYVDDTEFEELNTRDTLIGGYIKMAIGSLTNKCPVDGTVIGVSMKLNDFNITGDSYDIELKIKNLPSEISSIASKYSNAIDIFSPTTSFNVAKVVLNEFTKPSVAINMSVSMNEESSVLTVQTDDVAATNSWKDDYFSWLLNPKGQLYLLKEIGIIKECRLKSESVTDVDGTDIDLGPNKDCEILAIGECTNLPRFAIMKIPSIHGLALRIYTGGNYAEIQPTASTALRVVVNDHEVKWQPSYQFPENEQFYDFKISGSGDRLKFESKISAIKVIYRKHEAVILLPTTHLSLSCGACLQSDVLYKKC
ncbi:vitellogenin-5-like [Arctopsyche grandis]|uniref:vitellogenin-5-like n=1 Tax=Arctopsyche grandis TaxID=121162 RepID=UPI00406DA124